VEGGVGLGRWRLVALLAPDLVKHAAVGVGLPQPPAATTPDPHGPPPASRRTTHRLRGHVLLLHRLLHVGYVRLQGGVHAHVAVAPLLAKRLAILLARAPSLLRVLKAHESLHLVWCRWDSESAGCNRFGCLGTKACRCYKTAPGCGRRSLPSSHLAVESAVSMALEIHRPVLHLESRKEPKDIVHRGFERQALCVGVGGSAREASA